MFPKCLNLHPEVELMLGQQKDPTTIAYRRGFQWPVFLYSATIPNLTRNSEFGTIDFAANMRGSLSTCPAVELCTPCIDFCSRLDSILATLFSICSAVEQRTPWIDFCSRLNPIFATLFSTCSAVELLSPCFQLDYFSASWPRWYVTFPRRELVNYHAWTTPIDEFSKLSPKALKHKIIKKLLQLQIKQTIQA